MFRLAFIAYLSFVALAGPSFCCCTAHKVGAWLAGQSASAGEYAPKHTCCARKKSVTATASSQSDGCGPVARAASDGHDCQCPEHDSEAVQSSQRPESAKTLDDPGFAVVWPPVTSLPAQFAAETRGASRRGSVRTSLALLGGQEILRALQRFLL